MQNMSGRFCLLMMAAMIKHLEVIKFLRLQDERINFVDLSRNFGKVAMLAGFDYATGDCLSDYGC